MSARSPRRQAELAAIASRNASLPDLPHFATVEELLEKDRDRRGVALHAAAGASCPGRHGARRRQACHAGKAAGIGVAELDPLIAMATEAGRTLFATWHSRHCSLGRACPRMAGCAPDRRCTSIGRKTSASGIPARPGFEPGGLGVFDPGINALSILTRILPKPVFVTAAELAFPANCQSPIAANLTLTDIGGLPITAEFDFRQTGPQTGISWSKPTKAG